MGVDLTLLPLAADRIWMSHDIIRVGRRRELWGLVAQLPQKPIPEPLYCFDGPHEESPYGERLTYTTAADLLTLKEHDAVTGSWTNRAVWAYLAQMPPDWPIVLYWN